MIHVWQVYVRINAMYVTQFLRTERAVINLIQMFAFFCFTDSTSLLDDTDAEFRSRVEKIRQMGGDSWLKIFGEIQVEEEMSQVSAAFIITIQWKLS